MEKARFALLQRGSGERQITIRNTINSEIPFDKRELGRFVRKLRRTSLSIAEGSHLLGRHAEADSVIQMICRASLPHFLTSYLTSRPRVASSSLSLQPKSQCPEGVYTLVEWELTSKGRTLVSTLSPSYYSPTTGAARPAAATDLAITRLTFAALLARYRGPLWAHRYRRGDEAHVGLCLRRVR